MNKFITLTLFLFLSLVLFLTGCDGFNTNTTQKEENTSQQNPAIYTTTFSDEADFDYLQTNPKNTLKNKKEDACIIYFAVEKRNGKYRYEKRKLNLFLPENIAQGTVEKQPIQYMLLDNTREVLKKANCTIPDNESSMRFVFNMLKEKSKKSVEGGKNTQTKNDEWTWVYDSEMGMWQLVGIQVEAAYYEYPYLSDWGDFSASPYAQWDPYYYEPNSGGGGGGGSSSGSGGGSSGGTGSVNADISYENLDPCVQKVAQDLISIDSGLIKYVLEAFADDSDANIHFNLVFQNGQYVQEIGDSSVDYVGRTLEYDKSSNSVTIELNPYYFDKSSDLSIANTILHESIHAFLKTVWVLEDRTGYPTFEEMANLFYSKIRQSNGSIGDAHHIVMAESYTSIMAKALEDYWNSTQRVNSGNVSSYLFDALAWSGLQFTQDFKDLSEATKFNILNMTSIERLGKDSYGEEQTQAGSILCH